MRIAALDLGTNSFHLLIADVHPDGSFTPLAREKEMLRLGDSVSREGFIPPEAADVAVATVRRMKMLAEAADATEIVACATSAIRLAANGDELVDRIERETGVEVDVINGLTEARLIFGAIRASVLLEPAPALCFDLGGGSLEVMVGTASELLWATSENLGVARLTADFVHSDPISKADRRALRAHLTTALRGVAREVRPFEPKLVVGSSGTLDDLAAMVAARRGAQLPASLNQLTFARDEFLSLHDEILASKASERRRMVGLEQRHATYRTQHGLLRGVAPEEVALLAALARWHRRGEPRATEELGPLGPGGEERLRKLTALLRIADGLDRSRSQAVDHIDVNVGPSLVMTRLSSDRDPELEEWGARRKRDLFEKVFNRELEVTAHPSGSRAAMAAS